MWALIENAGPPYRLAAMRELAQSESFRYPADDQDLPIDGIPF